MEKVEIKKNIKGMLKLLLFLFGIGLMIFSDTLEYKFFGLVYMALSLN